MDAIRTMWVFAIAVLAVAATAAQAQATQELRMNPALDYFNLEHYFRHRRLWGVQRKCLFERGPCDIVGRWLKPRLAKVLMGGKCEMCTGSQAAMISNLIEYLKYEQPDIYDQALKSFLTEEQLGSLLTGAILRPQPNSVQSHHRLSFYKLPKVVVQSEVFSGSDENPGKEVLFAKPASTLDIDSDDLSRSDNDIELELSDYSGRVASKPIRPAASHRSIDSSRALLES